MIQWSENQTGNVIRWKYDPQSKLQHWTKELSILFAQESTNDVKFSEVDSHREKSKGSNTIETYKTGVTNENTFSKETRPRVYEYQNVHKESEMKLPANNQNIDYDRIDSTDSTNSVRKSAEFTFSQFKDFKFNTRIDNLKALSEQPYFTNRAIVSTASKRSSM